MLKNIDPTLNFSSFLQMKEIKQKFIKEFALYNPNENQKTIISNILNIFQLLKFSKKIPFSSFFLSFIKDLALSSDLINSGVKICQNINEDSEMRILLFLMKNLQIKDFILTSLENEKLNFRENLSILNYFEFLTSLLAIDISPYDKNRIFLMILTFLKDFYEFYQNKPINEDFSAYFLSTLHKFIKKIPSLNVVLITEHRKNILDIIQLYDKNNIMKKLFYLDKNISLYYSMDVNKKLKNKTISIILGNFLNILLILYIDEQNFFHIENQKFDKFNDFINFLIFVRFKKITKNPKRFKKIISLLMKSLFEIQDDYFITFALNIIDNFNKISTKCNIFKKIEKIEIIEVILLVFGFDSDIVIDFLVKDCLFLELFLKIIGVIMEQKEVFFKRKRNFRFFKDLLKKLKRSYKFPYNVNPLIKKIEIMNDKIIKNYEYSFFSFIMNIISKRLLIPFKRIFVFLIYQKTSILF